MKIKLGEKYTDNITGFTGVATARIEYLTGCVHIGLQGKVKEDGSLPAAEYFDECRLDSTIERKGGPATEIKPQNIHH